nr:PREDICTED: uncharacterized protein LOC103314919 [Tribolium castaneum]|eukprot:XP_008200439.2 PREDICTED: uncharacterized protein LOC103314919 [Tribolium castaneum]
MTSDSTDFIKIFNSSPKKEIEKAAENVLLAPSPYSDFYKMDHSRRGMAVIFNHVHFSIPECSRRDGSDKDRDDLVDVLHDLDFDVVAHDDLTAHEIVDVLITGNFIEFFLYKFCFTLFTIKCQKKTV